MNLKMILASILVLAVGVMTPIRFTFPYGGNGGNGGDGGDSMARRPSLGKSITFLGNEAQNDMKWVIGCGQGILLTKKPVAGGSSGKGKSKGISDDTRKSRKSLRDWLISGYKQGRFTEEDVRARAESIREVRVFTKKDVKALDSDLGFKTEPPPTDKEVWKMFDPRNPAEAALLYAILEPQIGWDHRFWQFRRGSDLADFAILISIILGYRH